MRNDKKGVGRYHAPELGVVEGDGSEDSPKLLCGRLDAPRDVPIAGKEGLRDVALVNTQVAPATESVAESAIAGPQSSNGRPMSPDKGGKIVGESTEGPE